MFYLTFLMKPNTSSQSLKPCLELLGLICWAFVLFIRHFFQGKYRHLIFLMLLNYLFYSEHSTDIQQYH